MDFNLFKVEVSGTTTCGKIHGVHSGIPSATGLAGAATDGTTLGTRTEMDGAIMAGTTPGIRTATATDGTITDGPTTDRTVQYAVALTMAELVHPNTTLHGETRHLQERLRILQIVPSNPQAGAGS